MTNRKGYVPPEDPHSARLEFLAKHRNRLARDLGIDSPWAISGLAQTLYARELLRDPALGETLKSKAILLRVLQDAINTYISEMRLHGKR